MSAAGTFVGQAICEWGQPVAERVAAVQGVLDAAKWRATATCWPVFGGIRPEPCTGEDGPAASDWLRKLTDTMQRGKYEREVEHVERMIAERVAQVAAA